MNKKYYAVRKGHSVGLFEALNDYRKAMRFYKGAEGCGFNRLEKAEEYIKEIINIKDFEEKKVGKYMINPKEKIDAIIDGSFKDYFGSYSIILFQNDKEVFRDFSFLDYMDDCTSVKSELMASRRAIELAIANDYKQITIFHDYDNTSNFINKESIVKDPFCKSYVRFIENAKKYIDIKFVKVKTKKGKNKIADVLCKRAIRELKTI
jgi:viroplasmin and RNaseH domain-containing protein